MPIIVKNTTFVGLLDLLAPHSCRGCGRLGDVLCYRCKNYIVSHQLHLCPNCKHPLKTTKCLHCPDLPPTYIVGERQDLIGTLIHDFKYQSVHALARPLAEILDSILPSFSGKVFIVPLPTVSRHVRTRGLDHTYLVAKRLARLRGYEVKRLLIRASDTVQVGTDRSTRLRQATTAYQLTNLPIDPEATYLILDDVWTTGASMRAATKKLRQAGASQITLAILALSRLD